MGLPPLFEFNAANRQADPLRRPAAKNLIHHRLSDLSSNALIF